MIHMWEADEHHWLLALPAESAVRKEGRRRLLELSAGNHTGKLFANKPRHNTVCIIQKFRKMVGVRLWTENSFWCIKGRFLLQSQKKNQKKKGKKNKKTICFAFVHLLIVRDIFQACTCIWNCLLNCSVDLKRVAGIEDQWKGSTQGWGRIATQGKSNHGVCGPSTDSPLQIAISAE